MLRYYVIDNISGMTIKQLTDQVKQAGGRLTKLRLVVLRYLSSCDRPVSATDIARVLKAKSLIVNRTTIYREIIFLLKHGLIREIKVSTAATLYELNQGHLHHLICLKCNKIKTIKMDNHLHNEEKSIMQREKFKIINHALEFYGLCQRCRN